MTSVPHLPDHATTHEICDIHDYFEIERCKVWCKTYTNIALQFPDHLLAYSTQVYAALSHPSRNLHILADTNYGACCVDEVAAQRLSTDAIIHFGHSCHSRVLSLPTLFVYGREALSLKSLVKSYTDTFSHSQNVHVVFNSLYYHCSEEFSSQLTSYPHVKVQSYSAEQNTEQSLDPWVSPLSEEDKYSIFYVGEESLCLTNVILNNGSRDVWSYNPVNNETQLQSINVNKMLTKRFSYIDKIRTASIIGILVGTLGIRDFNDVIKRMKQVLKAADKKYYVVSIGKPNPPKLANFAEIPIFVMIGCPENSLLDCKEFFQPIVTPYEVEIACIGRVWNVDYISNCPSLLDEHYLPIPAVEVGQEHSTLTMFSGLDVATCNLYNRAWSGLEQRLGQDEPARLKQGQMGIAGFYEDESDCDTRLKS